LKLKILIKNHERRKKLMKMNPVIGFLKTLLLFVKFKVKFDKKDTGRVIIMEDGASFKIFRRVIIKYNDRPHPQAVFIVRFTPANMSVEQNIRFSLIPMMIFMGFRGFRSKYWCVNQETGMCQGIYEWQTLDDANNYADSIAMRFMTKRSVPGSVSNKIIDIGKTGKRSNSFFTQ
jgi:hypothetical protein